MQNNKLLIAIVGMPGAGKSEATSYLKSKNLPSIRFGSITDEAIEEQGLQVTPENEQQFREKIRKELGMAAYAIQAKPRVDALLEKNDVIVIDGLYSWEEYTYLKQFFPKLILIHIFTEPIIRYKRLATRSVRPLSINEARMRDIAEIEKLHKDGPIAMADYLIENNASVSEMQQGLNSLLQRLHITL